MSNKEKTTQQEGMQNVESALNRTESWFERNKKIVIIIFAAIIVIGLGILAYFKFIREPRIAAAQAELTQAEYAFEQESFDTALNGNDVEGTLGFAGIVEEYGNTPAGNAARYYAGVCCMRTGEYDKAIEYLQEFESSDPMVGPMAIALIGDANMELGHTDEAIAKYKEAAEKANNDFLTPIILKKLGDTYFVTKKYSDALETYQTIVDKYYYLFGSQQRVQLDKAITRTKTILGK